MRDHSKHVAGGRHEVVEDLLSRIDFTRRTETVPVAQACGRVCAKTYEALNTLPNALTCNMDAIAVHFEDFEDGMPDISDWKRGEQWQFSNTGVAMPSGFDTAIRIEGVEVSEEGELLAINAMPREKYASTTPVGANLQPGDLLVKKGEVLSPVLLSVLNMGGYTEVEVIAKPVVSFIPTGNELVAATSQVPEGKNVDSNSTMVCAMLEQWGAAPKRYDIIPDDRDTILATLRDAAATCDVVVINAGSSKGSDDWTCELLEEYGEILYHEVHQAPGKHCSFAVLDGKPVIGISGPPFGAEFNAEVFIKPFVDVFLGVNTQYPPRVMARMMDSIPMDRSDSETVICQRMILRRDMEGNFYAWACQRSGDRPMMRGTDPANALTFIPKNGDGYQEGDIWPVELRWPYTIPPLMEW